MLLIEAFLQQNETACTNQAFECMICTDYFISNKGKVEYDTKNIEE
jgi:hypothetical protein